MIAPDLLAILVCPTCRSPLIEQREASALDCRTCAVRYPVRNGIPILLADEAAALVAAAGAGGDGADPRPE
jgi:uncharacterized protein YbaR (Trm112 family)